MVESRMGAVAWGLRPSPRFPSPLIKPDVPISGIRLSGWLHRKAHDGPLGASVRSTGGLRLCLAIELSLKGPDLFRRCQAHRQSPSPHHRQKRTRSQGPLLRRHYTASTLLRPCPTPAVTAACCDVEAAILVINGSPPITRTTFPTCRAHYPGGLSGCTCRLLPRLCSLPQLAGGSASALSLSRPAQALLTLRPARSLSRPTATFVARLQPSRLPDQAAR